MCIRDRYVIREKSIMRVTRNADIDAQSMYDEDMDYRNMMEELILSLIHIYEFFMVRVGSLMMQMNSKEKIFENKTKMSSEEIGRANV